MPPPGVSGSDMAVTVTLKDTNTMWWPERPSLTADTVTVPRILKFGSRWRDNGDGTLYGHLHGHHGGQ
ncbi:hypothetical protein KCP77_02290 [Salmonella enterica subsp. enterica]|nr:hypothetical protein KCP77_02290 [Salmonella enterica subsp. enterica]